MEAETRSVLFIPVFWDLGTYWHILVTWEFTQWMYLVTMYYLLDILHTANIHHDFAQWVLIILVNPEGIYPRSHRHLNSSCNTSSAPLPLHLPGPGPPPAHWDLNPKLGICLCLPISSFSWIPIHHFLHPWSQVAPDHHACSSNVLFTLRFKWLTTKLSYGVTTYL